MRGILHFILFTFLCVYEIDKIFLSPNLEKVTLCVLGGFENPFGAKQVPMASGALAYNAVVWEGRPGSCRNVLLILLVSFVWSQNGLQECAMAILQVSQSTWIEPPPD